MTSLFEATPARRQQWSSAGYVVVREALTARQVEAAREDALRWVPEPSSEQPGQLVEHRVAAVGGLAQLAAPLAAELLGVDNVAVSDLMVRAIYGKTRHRPADTLSRSDGAGEGGSLRFVAYLTDVTLNDGPLFLVSSGAASAHVTGGAADPSAYLWEVPVCAPAGTAILYRPSLLARLANRRVVDGWRLTAHATFTTTATGGQPASITPGDAIATRH